MNSIELEAISNVQQISPLKVKTEKKSNFTLDQYHAAERAILEYYDKTCIHGHECLNCERDIAVEKIIAKSYGIQNFAEFEELLFNPY